LHVSVDSFPVKTNVHFPTDISLLYDSIRKSLQLTSYICENNKISDLRQSKYQINNVKRKMREISKIKKSTKSNNEEKLKNAHAEYVEIAQYLVDKLIVVLAKIDADVPKSVILSTQLSEINKYLNYTKVFINQIVRRLINKEVIPHSEKVFSIFEPHTQWISKGKAGVKVELGIPVAIMKDQHGYILLHEVMQDVSDVDVAVPMLKKALLMCPLIKSCSFDRGFWSKENRRKIGELVTPIMPKKGKLNKTEAKEQNNPKFIELRKKHSAVESAINGLNHTGLNKCYDHGIEGFERCVSLSVLTRNILNIGNQVKNINDKKKRRKTKNKSA